MAGYDTAVRNNGNGQHLVLWEIIDTRAAYRREHTVTTAPVSYQPLTIVFDSWDGRPDTVGDGGCIRTGELFNKLSSNNLDSIGPLIPFIKRRDEISALSRRECRR